MASRTSSFFGGASWNHSAIYCAFDLLQIDGRDLRDEPIETRKAELSRLLTGCQPLALVLNRVYDDPGPVVFDHACSSAASAL
jgi:ATP-dependent DNA ligase